MKTTSVSLLCVGATFAYGQILPEPQVQSTGWNSSFKFTPEQIELGKLTPELSTSLETILNFDRSQLANGGPSQDDFYKLDSKTHSHPPRAPGEVLKVQQFTDPSVYNIPAQTALSRILYSSTNLNGTLVPASAYVLWPYSPKGFGASSKHMPKAKAPVVLWTHGTSGFYADGAPSAHRSLFYSDIVPFTLAQAGYVVVAPDYAGLGVETSWDGSFVPHQYLAREASAGDALNALRAVRKPFSDRITDKYVVTGHSQGGVVAWGISEVLAQHPQKFKDIQKDHIGTVVFNSGSTSSVLSAPQIFFPWIGKYLSGVFPTFELSDWLTPLGVARTKLLDQIQGGQLVSEFLFSNVTEIVKPTWNESWYFDALTNLANPGSRPFKGPMVLFEGTEDQSDGYHVNMALFDDTCDKYPGDFEFVAVPNAGHFPTMDAARRNWLQWIEDRFEGTSLDSKGCFKSELKNFLPSEQYQVQRKSFSQWSGSVDWFYQLPAV